MADDLKAPRAEENLDDSTSRKEVSADDALSEESDVDGNGNRSDLLEPLGISAKPTPINAPNLLNHTVRLLSPAAMKAVEGAAINSAEDDLDLMERAGREAAAVLVSLLGEPDEIGGTILILCGRGGNGGDGFVIARLLMQAGYAVRARTISGRAGMSASTEKMLQALEYIGAKVADCAPEEIHKAAVIVDAMIGGGLQKSPDEQTSDVITAINASDAYVFAVDVPTGLDGSSGLAPGIAVQADASVTFHRRRPGHVMVPGRFLSGGDRAIAVADIGLTDDHMAATSEALYENTPTLWGYEYPQIGPAHHKYDRGHVLVLGGQEPALGAARLAAQAALRLGAGLVTMAAPVETYAIQAAALTDIMVRRFENPFGFFGMLHDDRINPVVIGPGAGVGAKTSEMVSGCIERDRDLVLDADALTSIAGKIGSLFSRMKGQVVLTPHDGEFSRLFPSISLAGDRIVAAREAATLSGAIIVLKGVSTLVASPDGRVSIAANAPSWLSVGGTGDVLSGAVAGLMAQDMPAFEAASAAVWMHGEAAMQCGKGMLASDLLPAFKHVLP